MHHEQICSHSGMEWHESKSVPALFARFIDTVTLDQAVGIFQRKRRHLK